MENIVMTFCPKCDADVEIYTDDFEHVEDLTTEDLYCSSCRVDDTYFPTGPVLLFWYVVSVGVAILMLAMHASSR